MPATITHQLFGEDLLADLRQRLVHGDDVDETLRDTFTCTVEGALTITSDRAIRDAFLLGNQGPDPLFFAWRGFQFVQIKKFGSRIHHKGGQAFMDALRDYVWRVHPSEQPVALAYLCWFICHYLLDRTVHPLVYAQQFPLMESGVADLAEAGQQLHGQIEADLDAVCLYNLRKLDISGYKPHVEALQARRSVLDIVDKCYRFAAATSYGVVLPSGTFRRSVEDMRFSLKVMWSPDGRRRSNLGHLERSVRSHSLAQAMSVRSGVGPTCDFDNHQHAEWANPFDGSSSSASFFDLLDAAHAEALELIPRYVVPTSDDAAAPDDAAALTVPTALEVFGPRNFRGDIEE